MVSVQARVGMAVRRRLDRYFPVGQAAELYYLEMLRRADADGWTTSLLPVGSAGNASLLYVLVRALRELGFEHALEFGGGVSSSVLSRALDAGLVQRATTVEHDPAWAAQVSKAASHRVMLSTLTPIRVGPHATDFYADAARIDLGGNALVLLDGPIGTPRRSRLGIVPFLERHVPDRLLLVLDDCDRLGEQDTIDEVRRLLRSRAIPFGEREIRGAKWQHLIYTRTCDAAGYF